MEAFVAVAKAQGDESQISSGNSLDSPTFPSSCRNTSTGLGTPGRQNFSLLPHHHVSASSSSSLSRRELLDNGHYWKYLVGESSSPNMVPQEPSMATNDGVSKTPSPSSSSSVVAGGAGVEENTNRTTTSSPQSATTNRPSNPTESTTNANNNNSSTASAGEELLDEQGVGSPGGRTTPFNAAADSSPPPPPPGGGCDEVLGLRGIITNNNSTVSNNNSTTSSSNNSSKVHHHHRSSSAPKSNRSTPPNDSGGGSDVERFEGKIVYNPDGSAYIIEDSELSDDDTSLDVPEGCIVDGKGASLSQISSAIPQIANAIYVSRNPALYTALYGQAYSNLLQDKKLVPDIPIIHSYRVFTIRDSKCGDTSAVSEDEQEDDEEEMSEGKSNAKKSGSGGGSKSRTKSGSASSNKEAKKLPTPFPECASVPIKPILMCFICKLSFGYTKSFVGHAMGDHKLVLNEQENDILNQRNISAIIQVVGKNKDPLISFLEPLGNRIGTIPFQGNSAATAPSSLLPGHSGPLPLTSLPQVPMSRALHGSAAESAVNSLLAQQSLLRLTGAANNHSAAGSGGGQDDNQNNLKSSPASSPDLMSPRAPSSLANDILSQSMNSSSSALAAKMGLGVDLTRKSPASGRSSASPGASVSPAPGSVTPNPPLNTASPGAPPFPVNAPQAPPNFITGTTIGVCPEHINGRPSGVDCSKCELILNSSRMGGLGSLHTRNSCKTLKCPKCNWHYKYQETLEIHMKEKHPDNETSCIYCIAGQPHPRLARGETYTCGYKPYRCEVCNYSTTTKGNLSIHMQSDKHLNNMQELQNGGISPPESLVQQTNKSVAGLSPAAAAAAVAAAGGGGGGGGNNSSQSGSGSAPPPNPKPKPTFRCDVCNYETNVARNLRIHMTSEKHTHNMMVLQQNVKHMQHLSALQQAQNPFDPAALMQFHPGAAALGMAASQGGGGDKPMHTEAALADMAYSQALLIQMISGGQMPPHIPPELAPHMDLGLNPDTMEPPPEPPDPNPSHLFQCCVCTSYHTDSLEALSHHLTQDRTKLREQEILVLVAGNYMCKLCSYKTNLKANFQLHCKTDKHLQRLQHVNHVKEGGPRNEWKLKYLSMSNPIQVRCNACDYYTNSAHKLQLHAAHQRHEISVLIFRHIQNQESPIPDDARIYACALCGFTTRVKLQLLQHTRSIKHLQLEQLHSLQRRAEGKDGQPDLTQIFRVLEQPESDSPVHNNNSTASADVSPNFYNDQGQHHRRNHSREIKREENRSGGGSSVLKNALEKESSDYTDLTCPYCTFTADSETRLQIHVASQHSNSEWSGTSSGTASSSLERERQRDRERSSSVPRRSSSPESKILEASTTEQMACPLCQETCSDRHRLESHVMQVHSVNAEGLKRLLLLVNQSHWLNTSSGRSSANNSTSSSAGGDVKSGELNDDDKDKSETDGFLEENGDSDEYRCQSCLKSFRNLDDLCTHQNETGHLEIKQTPGGPGYLCWKKGCNQYFPTAPSLQMHFREIHARGSQSMAVSEKHVYKYRCNQCSLAFKTMEKLQIHSQYHAIRDASKCCLCGRSFRSLLALQKHVETSHTELNEEELSQFKQSIASNPLLLAGLSGQVLDPATTELLKKESARGDDSDLMMDEENRDDSITGEKDDGGMNESGDGDSNDSVVSKDQQLFEDYLNSQAMAEDSYNDPNRKYKCHRCKVAFTRQSYLTSHNKTLLHRKGEKLSYPMEKYLDPNRPYKCEVCKESFTQKNILLVHYNSVSHLHKLKRAMQEQQQFLSQMPTSIPAAAAAAAAVNLAAAQNNMSSSGAATNLISPVSSKATNSTTPTGTPTPAAPATPTPPSSLIPSAEEDDKKPYKCNICKVAYTQGSTLDIHMRSVLHQTRASKLHELAMTGQIDLSKPLIEQPEHQKLQEQQKKLMQEMLSPKSGEAPLSFSTPIRASSPASSAQSHTSSSSPQNASSAVSPAISSSPQTYPCHRCNVVCGSQEQLVQHQHLYCMFQNSLSLFPPLPSPNSSSTPNTSMMGLPESHTTPVKQHNALHNEPSSPSSPVPPGVGVGEVDSVPRFSIPAKKSSQMFKHLLETYGFEVVMQFNEYHQKRLLSRDVEDEAPVDEQILQEFPELAKATCPNCKKSFSSVWILKAHCEEIHKDVVSTEVLETFGEDFRAEYLKKVEAAAAEAASAMDKESDDMMIKEGAAASIAASLAAAAAAAAHQQQQASSNASSSNNKSSSLVLPVDQPGNPTAPSTPTASTTPASSADSVTGNSGNANSNNNNNNSVAAAAAAAAAAASAPGHQAQANMLAQHMNDVQAALTAMAASQLQHFNPMINPMVMAQLGMALPLGLNMNALAAMNLQPPLVPMMMPPPFDPMNQLSQGQNNPAAAAAAALFPQQMDSGGGGGGGGGSNSLAKQQQQILQQQQQAAAAVSATAAAAATSGQKRARTRITDDQLKILRSHFDINNSPSEDQIQQMAQQSGLPPKVIKHWFRNTLFKERQRNKDSPYNFNNPPSTTLNLEEYEKTGEAKVIPLPPEEQKKYVDAPLPSNSSTSSGVREKSPSKKSQQHHHQQQQQQQLHQQQQQQHHQQQLHHQAQLQHHQQQLLNAMQQEALDMKFFNHDNQSEASESESRSEDERPTKVSKRDFGGSNSSLTSALAAAQKSHRSSSVSSLTGEPNPSSSPSGGLNLSSLVNSQLSQLQQDSNSSSCSQPMLPPPKMGNFATPTQVPNQTSLLSLASPVALSSPGSGRSDTPLTTPPLPSNTSQSSSSGKRANRTRFTDYQIKVLQEFFENNAYPKDDDLEYLSKLLSLSPRVIVVWFQNARQKARKVYENQPPLDQQEEGTGRFQRTPGLNYQCKKCLLVFQRYYELIRHQKTHCYKEEDAKRSAQAQAAAAQVAAAMSSEDSNSSTVTDNNSLTSSCGPSPAAPGQSTSSSIGRPNPSQSPMTLFNAEMKAQMKLESQDETFQCDKCNLVFPRFDLWREHQLVHIMNPNLFPSYSPESPFGILQHHAQQQQQQQQQSQPPQSPSPSPIQSQSKETSQQSHSAASSIAGDATAKRKWSADEKSDDDKDESGQQRDKRLRTTILPEQLDYLYQKYQVESNPSRKMLETIAREVGLKKRVVQVNTRARERKGQFRAHAQVINKRCPFCPALFKVKSALETHLAAKHADQYTKGDINIDALPDEELDSASSPLRDNTKVPISFGASTTNSLGAAPSSPSSNLIAPFLHSLSTHAELESSLKKLYEESLKRYAQEVQAANQNGRAETQTPTDLRMMKGEAGAAEFTNPGGEIPLDLSKPVDLSRAFGKIESLDTASLMDNDYLSDGDDFDASHDTSNPNSPASSTASQRPCGPATQTGNKRYRTQLAALQVKVMKNLFADYKTPTMAECEMLGREIGLAKRVVQVWFQNSRAKDKKSKLAQLKASSSTLSTTTTSSSSPPPPPGSVASGQEQSLESLTSSAKPPEECKLCGFKYSHKYSIQDHIFTKKHIEMIKTCIESGKLDPEAGSSGAGVSSVAVQGQSGRTTSPVNKRTPMPAAGAPVVVNSTGADTSSSSPLGIVSHASNLMAQLPGPTPETGAAVVSNGQQQQQQQNEQQHQAAFLQQLQLLQLAVAVSSASTTPQYNIHSDALSGSTPSSFNMNNMNSSGIALDGDHHDGSSGGGGGGSGADSVSASASAGPSSSASNNANNNNTSNSNKNVLSPEDILQLYGLGNLVDASGSSSSTSTGYVVPASSSANMSSGGGGGGGGSSSVTSSSANTFSSLMQHPLLSNAASALSTSSTSSTTGK